MSHAATRNGASILLLDTLQWLCARGDFDLEILVQGGGDLLEDLRAIAPTIVWRNPARRLRALAPRLETAWLETFGLQLRTFGRSYDLVYLNTAAVSSYVPALRARARRVLWHIHELDYGIRMAMGPGAASARLAVADRIIAVSQAVGDVLSGQFAVSPEKIDIVHGFVSAPASTPDERRMQRRARLESLGLPFDSFVVGACGGMGWRKGTDLFLQMAGRLCATSRDGSFRFLWVGDTGGEESLRFQHDAQQLGIADRCRLIPVTAQVADLYQAMDVFALTSREDPFPLVMLEAGARHVPTVCFARSGGGPEFAAEAPELVAPYLDVAGLASRVEALRKDPSARSRFGDAAARRVRAGHIIETQAPKVLASIQRCLTGPGGPHL